MKKIGPWEAKIEKIIVFNTNLPRSGHSCFRFGFTGYSVWSSQLEGVFRLKDRKKRFFALSKMPAT